MTSRRERNLRRENSLPNLLQLAREQQQGPRPTGVYWTPGMDTEALYQRTTADQELKTRLEP